jgi:Flp pilus assembly protein TadD
MRSTLMMLVLVHLGLSPTLAWQGESQSQRDTSRSTSAAHTIRGRVYLPSGHPTQDQVRITLRTITQGIVQEAFTDSVGNFEFRGIPGGSYEVVAWGNDKIETTVEKIEVFGRISRTFFQNVFLKEKSESQDKPKAGVVSVAGLMADVPKQAQKEYERGVKQVDKGEYEKAIAHFERAIQLYPEYVQAYNDLGAQYLRLNRFTEAEAAFTKAVTYEPRAPQPYLNLGYMRLLQKQYQDAVLALNRAIELDSTNWAGHLWLGVALMEVKEHTLSKSALEKALVLGNPPEVSPAHLYLANIYIRQGDLIHAIEQSELYLKEVPNAENAEEIRAKIAKMRSVVEAQSKNTRQ